MRTLFIVAACVFSSAGFTADSQYSLTVYSSARPGQLDTQNLQHSNGNLPGYALIRDTRNMSLQKGRAELRFSDVASRMDPTTVSFASLTDPLNTRVIEQNYQYDLVSAEKLQSRFLGERITVEQTRGNEIKRISGELLSAQGGLTLKLDSGEISTINQWSGVIFPSLPGGLITKPTLVWLIDAEKSGTHKVQVSYQAKGMTWWTDYNATLDESKGCRLDVTAWITMVNQSGASYPGAKLKLVAGEVNRAPSGGYAAPPPAMAMMKMAESAGDSFQESELFEYHLYTLGRPTDIPDNSSKQIELFPAVLGVACKKDLVFTASPRNYGFWGGPNIQQGYAATSKGQVGAYLEFENNEANKMSLPLPAGRVRVNQLSKDGSLEFIGEDAIAHTPRNEKINLKLGDAFDIVGDRKQTNFTIDTTAKWMEESFEIEVRNRKKTAAQVVVREYLYRWSGWKISNNSDSFVKRDAQTADFVIDIPADGKKTVKYTVRYNW